MAGAIGLFGRGPVVLFAAAGLGLCLFFSAILLVLLFVPRGFQSVQTVAGVLVSAGILPETAALRGAPFGGAPNEGARAGARPSAVNRRGVAGSAARDATERSAVPGWDPVLQIPASDLATLDPDEAVERALGGPPDGSGTVPASQPNGGGFSPAELRNSLLSQIPLAGQGVAGMRAAAGAVPVSPSIGGGLPPTEPKAPPVSRASPGVGAVPLAGTPAAGAALPPVRQTLPPPPGAQAELNVYAVELAFFLDPEAAVDYAAALSRIGVTTRLVEQLDEAGRTWTYVRSPVFAGSVAALAYAARLEQEYGLPVLLVSEPPPSGPPPSGPPPSGPPPSGPPPSGPPPSGPPPSGPPTPGPAG